MNDPVKDFVYDILQLPEWAAFDARTKEVKALRDAIWHKWKDNPQIKRFIPVTQSFNEAVPPVGRVDVESDDGLMIRMVKDSGFDPELFTVAPSFIIKKQDKNGNILEAELLSLSVIPKQWQKDGVKTK